ncbi:MAG: TlpA disulfide reductase family protein [Algibacter sp.]
MLKRLFALAILLPSVLFAQHTIKGTFSPPEDYKFVLLYKVTPEVSTYVNNAEINGRGEFEFQLDSTITKGIYKLVYAIPQEDYNFDVIYNGNEDVELTFNSEIGVKFQSSVENTLLASYTNSMYMVTSSIGKFFREEAKDTLALSAIFKTQRETQSNYEEAAKGTIALNFIKANKPYIPNQVEDAATYVGNLKTHYFDAVDFENETLQSSDFLTERMFNYVFGVSANSIDEATSYIKNIKTFGTIIKTAPAKIKKQLFIDLWQQMADLNFESVANFIAEETLMDLAVSLNDQELLHALILYKNISIGNKAPDFPIEIKEKDKLVTKKLSELDVAESYILVFWSSMCSHCLEEIPQLQTYLKTKEKGLVQVVAIGLEDEPYKWKDLTYNYPEFLHVYGEGKWDNEIGQAYGVSGTPTYFILNKNKELAARPEDLEAVKAFFGEKEKEVQELDEK